MWCIATRQLPSAINKIYNSKLAAVSNQNVLLEAKLATMSQDFQEQMDALLEENAELKAQLEK